MDNGYDNDSVEDDVPLLDSINVDEVPLLDSIHVELGDFKETTTKPFHDDIGTKEEEVSLKEVTKGDVIRLLSLAKQEVKMLSIATFALVVGSGGNLVVPKFVGVFVDSIIDNTVLELSKYIFILLGVFLLVAIFSLIRASIFEMAGQRIVSNLRVEVFSKMVSQEIGFFDKSRTGELVNRLSADCEVLQNAVTVNISMFLRAAVQLLGAVIMCFVTSWKLTLVVISVIPVIALMGVFYGRYIGGLSTQVQDALAATTAFAEETLGNMQTVRAFCGEKFSIDYYHKQVWEVYEVQKKRAIATGVWAAVAGFVASLALAGSLWFGGNLCKSKELSPGTLTTFLFYTITVVTGVGMLSSLYTDLMKAIGASRRIFYLLDRVPQVRFSGGIKDLHITGKIQLKDVCFSYPSRPEEHVLSGFNLDIEPGKVVALVGHSGGGKTTVAKLLAGFYYPTSGQITVDDVDIHTLDPVFWRNHIGIVSQEPTLFAVSIQSNIEYACDPSMFENEKAKHSKVVQVAKMANAHEFIMELKDTYDTLVGERGVRLSGGQKQRVAIARALMRDPQVLIFDEATSALDSESEYKVKSALDSLITHRGGKGVLVIAHRLSTVKNADEIVVMDHGKVVERGKHEELMQKGGVYRDLVHRQLETKQ